MALFRRRNKSQKEKSFTDSPKTAVFTTKFVVEDKKTITYVSHDDDNSWQFFSNDDFKDFEDIARIVSLQEIIDIDPTLLEIADMPNGFYAIRKGENQQWTIHQHE